MLALLILGESVYAFRIHSNRNCILFRVLHHFSTVVVVVPRLPRCLSLQYIGRGRLLPLRIVAHINFLCDQPFRPPNLPPSSPPPSRTLPAVGAQRSHDECTCCLLLVGWLWFVILAKVFQIRTMHMAVVVLDKHKHQRMDRHTIPRGPQVYSSSAQSRSKGKHQSERETPEAYYNNHIAMLSPMLLGQTHALNRVQLRS